MRYFLVSFNPADKLAFGHVAFGRNGFFSYDDFLEEVKKISPNTTTATIFSIFEFKDREDYRTFIGEEKESDADFNMRYQNWCSEVISLAQDKYLMNEEHFLKLVNKRGESMDHMFTNLMEPTAVIDHIIK